MKRDMDMIRDIMLYLEKNLLPSKPIQSTKIPLCDGNDEEYQVCSEHIRLILDEGMIEANKIPIKGFTIYDIQRITSKGHDFLDALRDDTIWKKVKDGASKVGGSTIAIMVDLGTEYTKKQLGLA